jgi:ubiquinone/menaquinone biosynthesis C-methylase UbiE
MNYFDSQAAAARYANGRPDFHSIVAGLIRDFVKPEGKFEAALDIACGTGLSTRALTDLATHVYGTDASPEMLRLAAEQERVSYSHAFAEKQPFADKRFGLITVCSGVHWFNIDQFLAEAHRLLQSKGWLVLYDNFFTADMEGDEAFGRWYTDVYLQQYPAPPRNDSYSWINENLHPKNLHLAKEYRFTNEVAFTKSALILYFTTQINIISAVENGKTSYEEASRWLNRELGLFFGDEKTARTTMFGNHAMFLQRTD